MEKCLESEQYGKMVQAARHQGAEAVGAAGGAGRACTLGAGPGGILSLSPRVGSRRALP